MGSLTLAGVVVKLTYVRTDASALRAAHSCPSVLGVSRAHERASDVSARVEEMMYERP